MQGAIQVLGFTFLLYFTSLSQLAQAMPTDQQHYRYEDKYILCQTK